MSSAHAPSPSNRSAVRRDRSNLSRRGDDGEESDWDQYSTENVQTSLDGPDQAKGEGLLERLAGLVCSRWVSPCVHATQQCVDSAKLHAVPPSAGRAAPNTAAEQAAFIRWGAFVLTTRCKVWRRLVTRCVAWRRLGQAKHQSPAWERLTRYCYAQGNSHTANRQSEGLCVREPVPGGQVPGARRMWQGVPVLEYA